MRFASSLLPLTLATTALAWFDYETQIAQGVNVGGWLVLEPYITPGLYQYGDEVVDEYHLTKKLGKEGALSVLEQHWKTWYTEKDVENMANAGINSVRIPVGYWAFAQLLGDPYVSGQVRYLDLMIGWARKYSIYVWIDLHGAPGSQNGFDNSGLRDQIDYQTDANIALTQHVLQQIFDKYGHDLYQNVISGIEFLNEPFGPASDMGKLKDFYLTSYKNARSVTGVPLVMHDAFQGLGSWNGFMTLEHGYHNVVVDHHHYQVFSQGELQRSIDEHVSAVCELGRRAEGENKWVVWAEFSAALTDCAWGLNGVGRGARWSGDYDGSTLRNKCTGYTSDANWSQEYRQHTRRFLEAQLDAFEGASGTNRGMNRGWFFWAWKTLGATEWDMARLIDIGLFPQPFSSRQFPNQCGF